MADENLKDRQIERYIHQRMSPEEVLLFEQEMKSDPQLKEQVETLIEIKGSFSKSLLDLKSNLDAAEKELEQEGFFGNVERNIPTQKKAPKLVWFAAASVFIIVCAIFYFYATRTDYNKLAQNAALNDFEVLRGEYDSLHALFANGQYKQVVAASGKALNASNSQQERAAIILITSRSYILLNQPQAAINLVQSSDEQLQNDCGIMYSRGLAHLQLKDRNTAITYLNLLINRSDCFPVNRKANQLFNLVK